MSQAVAVTSISSMFAIYLFQVGIGLTALLPFIPPQATGHDFFKSMSTLSAVLVLIAWVLEWFDRGGGQSANIPLLAFSAGIVIYAATAIIFKRLFATAILKGLALAGVAALVVEALSHPPLLFPQGVSAGLGVANSLTAALMGGGFLLNMLFGHWYLVEEGIPIGLLLRAANIMLAVVWARVAVVAVTLGVALTSPQGTAVVDRLVALNGHGIFFWERIGAGLAIPLALAFMVRSTAKLGANQSATGLLYVGVAFAIMGELVAHYLFLLTGLPL